MPKLSSKTATTSIALTDIFYIAKDIGGGLFTSFKITYDSFKTVLDSVYASITRTQATDITSSSNVLNLNTDYGINFHKFTENTVLQVPDTSGWANGTTVRLDLFTQVDAGGSYAMTFHANWKVDGGVSPTLTATANAIDHLVVTITKTSGLTLAWIGLAGADIKVAA